MWFGCPPSRMKTLERQPSSLSPSSSYSSSSSSRYPWRSWLCRCPSALCSANVQVPGCTRGFALASLLSVPAPGLMKLRTLWGTEPHLARAAVLDILDRAGAPTGGTAGRPSLKTSGGAVCFTRANVTDYARSLAEFPFDPRQGRGENAFTYAHLLLGPCAPHARLDLHGLGGWRRRESLD